MKKAKFNWIQWQG